MNILWAILVGFIAGLIAKIITPGDPKPRGFILTTVLGIVGSVLGTFLARQIGWNIDSGFAEFVGAIVGAIIILIIWRQIAKPR